MVNHGMLEEHLHKCYNKYQKNPVEENFYKSYFSKIASGKWTR